jgi:hypothetical protein
MKLQEYRPLIERLLEDATQRQHVLAYAAAAKQKEIAQMTESGHITDDKPHAQPVYTVQEEREAWKKLVSALTAVRTVLQQIEQAEQQRCVW